MGLNPFFQGCSAPPEVPAVVVDAQPAGSSRDDRGIDEVSSHHQAPRRVWR